MVRKQTMSSTRFVAVAVVLGLTAAACLADEPKRVPPRFLGLPQDPVRSAADTLPKSSYDKAVATALGTLLSLGAIKSVCAASAPEFRDANEAAYNGWRKDQRRAVEDIEQHAKAMILENAQGDRDIAEKVRQLYETRLLASARGELDQSPMGLHDTCRLFPKVIKAPPFDLEKQLVSELREIREHR